MRRLYQQLIFPASILMLYSIAWIMQTHLTLNHDVIWDLHITQLALSGGQYIRDFFDISPPSTFYLYALPVLVAKNLHIDLAIATHGYTFILATISLFSCYILLKKYASLDKENYLLPHVVSILCTIIFLILPAGELGERDHLFLILIMPYILLYALHMQKNSIGYCHTSLIGMLAGLGVSIKPFFLLIPFLLASYDTIQQKKLFTWIRLENMLIIAIFFSYSLAALVYYPDYFSQLLPLIRAFYYQSIQHPWYYLILNPIVFLCYIAIAFSILQQQMMTHSQLSKILSLSLIGCLMCYFMQRTVWFYHLLPAFSIALILCYILFIALCKQFSTEKHSAYLTGMLLCEFSIYIFLMIFIIFNPFLSNLHDRLLIIIFASYLSLILFILLYYQKMIALPITLIVTTISLFLLWAISFFYTLSVFMSIFIFCLSSCYYLMILYKFAIKNFNFKKILIVSIGATINIILLTNINFIYNLYSLNKIILSPFTKYIHQYALGKNIYFFNVNIQPFIPPAYKAGSVLITRFAHFILIPEATKKSNDIRIIHLQKKIHSLYTNMVIEDLTRYHPRFIFIEDSPYRHSMKINYINYFSIDDRFKKLWHHYCYYDNVLLIPSYNIKVYKLCAL